MDYLERNRDFKGVWIPKEIWLNEELTMLEKIILVEIDSLDNKEHCVAGNDYLAQFCQCSEWKVSTAVKKLQDLGYIEIVSFDGRHRRIRSCLLKSTSQTLENPKAASESEESKDSLLENQNQTLENPNADLGKPKANNINNNITNNININNEETSSSPEKKSTDTKPSSKRKSRKDQLVEYVQATTFAEETKETLFKWIFQIGLKGNVTVDQLRDMLKKIWNDCSGNETLVREAINNSYLNNWFGFYAPKKQGNFVEKKPSNNLTLGNNKNPAQLNAQGSKTKLHPTMVF